MKARRRFVRHAAVGALAVTIDVAVFGSLAAPGWIPELAAVAGGLSMAVHFSLDKYLDLRKHGRILCGPRGTYPTVTSVWRVVALSVVALLSRGCGASPVIAKLIAVAVNLPLGFVVQRQLTFGAGIGAALRRPRAT